MKTILLVLAIALMSTFVHAQISTTVTGYSIKYWDGSPPAVRYYTTPRDTAKDSVVYIKPFYYNLAYKPFIYGMNIYSKCDTFATKLVLEGSTDSTHWTALDSLSVASQTVGQYQTIYDATLKPYGYFHLRWLTANVKIMGDVTGGAFSFFIQTNAFAQPNQ